MRWWRICMSQLLPLHTMMIMFIYFFECLNVHELLLADFHTFEIHRLYHCSINSYLIWSSNKIKEVMQFRASDLRLLWNDISLTQNTEGCHHKSPMCCLNSGTLPVLSQIVLQLATMLTTAKSEGRLLLISQSSPALYYLFTLFSTRVRVWASGRVGAVSDTQCRYNAI